jgi:hypothetical protein
MARKHTWDLALDDAIKVSHTTTSCPSHLRLTLIRDIVHQHSALVGRLHLQRHRPLRKKPCSRGKDSIRCCIHVHQPRFRNRSFSSPDKGNSILSRIFSASLRVLGHCTLQCRSTPGSQFTHQRAGCRLSEYRSSRSSCRGSECDMAMLGHRC